MTTRSSVIPTQEVWNLAVSETQHAAHDLHIWISRLSDGERVVGLCVFALIMMILMLRPAKKSKKPRDPGMQFVFALAIVVIFGFGAGWMFEGGLGVGQIVSNLF